MVSAYNNMLYTVHCKTSFIFAPFLWHRPSVPGGYVYSELDFVLGHFFRLEQDSGRCLDMNITYKDVTSCYSIGTGSIFHTNFKIVPTIDGTGLNLSVNSWDGPTIAGIT